MQMIKIKRVRIESKQTNNEPNELLRLTIKTIIDTPEMISG